jgi:choline dehydrogenase-like flavoprotein
LIIDARHWPGRRLQTRVCIVGSGMGGASAAKKLIEAGVDVLFIEAGGERPNSSDPLIRHQAVGQSFGVPFTRALELGGSTNLWHGICSPFDPIDFETRDWIADSGWPISYRDLAPHYAEALGWLGLAGLPLAAMEAAASAHEILASKAFWSLRTPARMKDMVLDWTQSGRARCLMHAVALQLRADPEGVVRSLLVGCGARTIEVHADAFIIAAGALETPRLLLNSGRGPGQGFGAGAAQTGRYLMDHPVGYFSQVVFHKQQSAPFGPPVTDMRAHFGFALQPELQHRFRLPNHYVFIRPGTGSAKAPNALLRSFLGVRKLTDLSLRQLLPLVTSPYILQRVARERLGIGTATRFGDIYVMAEQAPSPFSRVTLSDRLRDRFGYPIAQVDWRIPQNEWDHFGEYFSLIAKGLGADERIASLRLDGAEEWPQVLSSAAHHLGTARMAATPRRGVVDADLRVFGCSNLFVCDGSVFPTAGGTNPSLTISALALRLGDHLAKRLSTPVMAEAAVG